MKYIVPICLVLSGCASTAGSIDAVPVAAKAYAGLQCPALQAEYQKVALELAEVSVTQNERAANDAVGVALIGVPLGSIMQDPLEGRIGELKGKRDGLKAEMDAKACKPA